MQLAATQIEKWELVVQCSVCEEIRRSAVRAEAPPCGGSQNLQIPVLNGARPAGFGTRIFAPPVDRVGQKAGAGISAEPKPQAGSGSRNAAHPKQLFLYIILLRHYAASGLLNLRTTLMRTMIRTTPGRETAG